MFLLSIHQLLLQPTLEILGFLQTSLHGDTRLFLFAEGLLQAEHHSAVLL